jgi:hypothetical protein
MTMTPRIPESLSTWLFDWSPFAIVNTTVPPRDPNDDDDDDEEEEDEEDEDRSRNRSCANRIKTRPPTEAAPSSGSPLA